MLQLVQKNIATLATSLLAGVKLHLRVDGTDDDTDITDKIKSAIEYCETYTGLDFADATWRETHAGFPHRHHRNHIELQRAPLKAITSVTYYDTANVQQTLATTDYYALNPSNLPAWLEPKPYWPATYSRPDAVAVTYTTGFSTVPAMFLHAVNLFVGSAYENRASEITGTISKELEWGVHRLLEQLNTYTYQ